MTVGLLAVLVAVSSPVIAQTPAGPIPVESSFADVEGVRLHYLAAGKGPTVILLHGYTQTSRMWRPLIPRLAATFFVIAPDLPGSPATPPAL